MNGPVFVPICPECRAGKHRACSDVAADVLGEPVPCSCPVCMEEADDWRARQW
jgi:hypothetical protein